jgi:hypothetical protein
VAISTDKKENLLIDRRSGFGTPPRPDLPFCRLSRIISVVFINLVIDLSPPFVYNEHKVLKLT